MRDPSDNNSGLCAVGAVRYDPARDPRYTLVLDSRDSVDRALQLQSSIYLCHPIGRSHSIHAASAKLTPLTEG